MNTEYDMQEPNTRFCPNCGQEVFPESCFCQECGARLEEEEQGIEREKETVGSEEIFQERVTGEALLTAEEGNSAKGSRGIPSGFATGFFSLFFVLFATILMAMAFFHGLAANVNFPSVGGISGDRLTELLESSLPLILGGILVGIPLFCIVFLNIRWVRRIFLFLGIAGLLTGLLSFFGGLFWPLLVERMSGGLQNILKASMAAFQDVSFMYALLWLLLGAVLISVYSCITVCRGKKYEKNM